MKMELHTALKKLGLHASEIAVYLYLLEHGPSTVIRIGKGTGILRTNCYGVLAKLAERELVEPASAHQPRTYTAMNPASLLRSVERSKQTIDAILPDLLNLYNDQANKPIIKFYEGKVHVKEIFYQMIGTRELVAFASTETLHALYPDFFTGKWQKEFREEGGTLRDILTIEGKNAAAQNMKSAMGDAYEYRLIPKDHRPLATDLLVWDDNVALLALAEPIFGTVINNKQMAETFRLMFELIWVSLPGV